jgi:hypothetical protein
MSTSREKVTRRSIDVCLGYVGKNFTDKGGVRSRPMNDDPV